MPLKRKERINPNQLTRAQINDFLSYLTKQSVLFAHMSVGQNILDGLSVIGEEHDFQLSFAEESSARSNNACFVHCQLGNNGDPIKKIDRFLEFILALETPPKFALMKLCYLDIAEGSDPIKIFDYYQQRMEELAKKLPDTHILHCTVPLNTRSNRFKDRVKRLLGKTDWFDGSNVQRGIYNDKLKKNFASDHIFDIAGFQSTLPGGEINTFSLDGRKHHCMYEDYSNDGGHLNELGKRTLATSLLLFLLKNMKSTELH